MPASIWAGGVGTTTVATNLALIVAESHPNKVLLIDLDLSFGQVASHLNLQPKQTLLELARDDAALRDPELFRTYAIHHASAGDLDTGCPPSIVAQMIARGDIVARGVLAPETVISPAAFFEELGELPVDHSINQIGCRPQTDRTTPARLRPSAASTPSSGRGDASGAR